MADPVLFDTNVLIEAGQKAPEAVAYLEYVEQKALLAISMITQMELIVGCRNKKELNTPDRFLRRFNVLSLNESITDRAVELLQKYRLSHGLLIADALVAATALTNGVEFVTKNRRDYQFVEGLHLLPYPRIPS